MTLGLGKQNEIPVENCSGLVMDFGRTTRAQQNKSNNERMGCGGGFCEI